ncbi:ATP-binding protein [Cuneatibacter sp. NSJ-177]|uniref:ATP-binding protein n=1 Tax=Cuneatibacter sp. NSJ-177 TaxID=2931401 RepID=UPI002ED671D9
MPDFRKLLGESRIAKEMILYRDFEHQDIFDGMRELMDGGSTDNLYPTLNGLVEMANTHGFEGNVWHNFLAYILANHENAFSTTCEIRGKVEGSINTLALHDFRIFQALFAYDLAELDRELGTQEFGVLKNYRSATGISKVFNARIRDRIEELSIHLANTKSPDEFLDCVTQFYKEFGVGKYGLHKAFKVEHVEGGQAHILPITKTEHVRLSDLVGYELQKKRLIENTEAFVAGKKANNCLLFGDAGTGKSSSIKAILNEYYDQGLRMIEIYKHQFQDLTSVIAQIKNRNYKFIIYMDDLSFEDFEVEYKYLKAVIEGGLERRPENVLIYATSNRRHLIRERFTDKREADDELHSSDTVQEKLSLAYRFGVTIYYGMPDKKQFQHIVKTLAARSDLSLSEEELFHEANIWELQHGGMSGRTATQFITYLLGKEKSKEAKLS